MSPDDDRDQANRAPRPGPTREPGPAPTPEPTQPPTPAPAPAPTSEPRAAPTPDPTHPPTPAPAPARTLSTQQLEAVIRRAVELEAGTPGRADDGVSETDVVRIGRELGLDAATVRRAIAEVRTRPPEEHGVLARTMGPGTVSSSREIARSAHDTAARVERYLHDTELMIKQRRFPGRARYVRDSSLGAGMTRVVRELSRGPKPVNLQQVDVAVSPIDDERCLLEVSSDLKGARAGHAAGALGVGASLASGLAAFIWATPVADPLMLLGIPILGGAWAGMRAIYGLSVRSTRERLEALLERVEYDELA